MVSHFSRYPSITNRVSVPGRNISWSQCGIGLNIENPRIRYRPSSDFTWMSLMTSGVKIAAVAEDVLLGGHVFG